VKIGIRDTLITRGYIRAASHAFVGRLQSAQKADCRRRGGLSNFGTFWKTALGSCRATAYPGVLDKFDPPGVNYLSYVQAYQMQNNREEMHPSHGRVLVCEPFWPFTIAMSVNAENARDVLSWLKLNKYYLSVQRFSTSDIAKFLVLGSEIGY
jgi:hypothetical protein